MGDIRHVDFSPDEWLAGTAELSAVDRGVYITVCALIYSRGGPVLDELVFRHCGEHGNVIRAALRRLQLLGKIVMQGQEIDQRRAEKELIKARSRIEKSRENGRKGGRPNGLGKPHGLQGGDISEGDQRSAGKASEKLRKSFGNGLETRHGSFHSTTLRKADGCFFGNLTTKEEESLLESSSSESLSRGAFDPADDNLRHRKKEQLRQKLERFVNAKMIASKRTEALEGLYSQDPAVAQKWFDYLDRRMRSLRWDDNPKRPEYL